MPGHRSMPFPVWAAMMPGAGRQTSYHNGIGVGKRRVRAVLFQPPSERRGRPVTGHPGLRQAFGRWPRPKGVPAIIPPWQAMRAGGPEVDGRR